MELKIVNKNGSGHDTCIYVIENGKEIGQLVCVERIDFEPITGIRPIKANLKVYIRHIDLVVKEFERQTLYELHRIHNNREMKRLGLRGRIN